MAMAACHNERRTRRSCRVGGLGLGHRRRNEAITAEKRGGEVAALIRLAWSGVLMSCSTYDPKALTFPLYVATFPLLLF